MYFGRDAEVADSALEELIRRWDRVPTTLRDTAAAVARGRLQELGITVSKSTEPAERVALALAAQDLPGTELAAGVVNLLSDANGRVLTAAERALIALTNRQVFEYGSEAASDDPRERLELCKQLRRSIENCKGDVKAPFAAALAMLDPSTIRTRTTLAVWFLDPAADHSRLLAALRSRSNLISRLRAWQWLHVRQCTGASLDRLSGTTAPSDHTPILERGHLAARPARLAAASTLGSKVDCILPAPGLLTVFSGIASRGLAYMASQFTLPARALGEYCTAALVHPDPFVRRRFAALSPTGQCLDFCFDLEPVVARTAILRWSGAGVGQLHPSHIRNARNLARSADPLVRVIAEQELERLGGGELGSVAGRLHAWRAIETDRTAMVRSLEASLRTRSPLEQMRALQFARRLALVRDLESTLRELATRGLESGESQCDPRVLATILSLLKRLPSAAPLLTLASRSVEPRVRANAIESLLATPTSDTQLDPVATYAVAAELCVDKEPRVRANAIRGLLAKPGAILEAKPDRVYEPAALHSLASMLQSDAAPERLSAVWATERVLGSRGDRRIGEAWTSLSGTLTTLGESDGNSHVRRRAAAAARRLAVELRTQASPEEGAVA